MIPSGQNQDDLSEVDRQRAIEELRRTFSLSRKLSKCRKDFEALQKTGRIVLSALVYPPTKPRLGEKVPSERKRVLEIAEILHREAGKAVHLPTVALRCIDAKVWTEQQLARFVFQAAIRHIEGHLKSPDGAGLAVLLLASIFVPLRHFNLAHPN